LLAPSPRHHNQTCPNRQALRARHTHRTLRRQLVPARFRRIYLAAWWERAPLAFDAMSIAVTQRKPNNVIQRGGQRTQYTSMMFGLCWQRNGSARRQVQW